MKNITQAALPPSNPNLLKEIHAKLIAIPTSFRERVCDECDWGIPTFYRTMRKQDEVSTEKKNKIIPAISNANTDKIIVILSEVSRELQSFVKSSLMKGTFTVHRCNREKL
jgi:hypothetical protein